MQTTTAADQGEHRLATTALEALGDLSLGASELMTPYMEKLIPFVVASAQDSSSLLRREVRHKRLTMHSLTLWAIVPCSVESKLQRWMH